MSAQSIKPQAESTVNVSQDTIPYQEYLLRVLFASFQPAVRLGLELNYPLDTIKEMMTLALWKEAKAKHNTINLISLIFGKSTRTLKTLSARYNRGRFFQQSEMNLCRQVEDLLQKRPMCIEELSRRLPHYNEFDGASLAIQMLLKTGRVEEELREGKVVYIPITRHHNLYSDDWEMRIDALSEHSAAISETLRLRFLESTPDPRTMARTFTFQAKEEDITAFQEELLDFIRKRYRELEKTALKYQESDDPSSFEENSDVATVSPQTFDQRSDPIAEEIAAAVSSFSLYLGVTPTPKVIGNPDQ
jgi:hypothetical protein